MENDYSINTSVKKTFGIADYGLFAGTLAVSAVIGVFYAFKDKLNSKDYLLGGRRMSVVPVSLSILVTSFSATTLLGMPAEVYTYNTMIWWLCLSATFGLILSAVVFVPFFYNLNITSVYEYLEMRFGTSVRVFGSLLFVIQALTYMSFVLYVPSLALNAATNFDLWGSVIAVGTVATFYTAIGGMKAVLWSDTFQALIIFAGLITALIQGLKVVGGLEEAWTAAAERSRIYFTDFNPHPFTRHSFWSLVLGGSIMWLSIFCSQMQMQRVLSCRSATQAKVAMFASAPFLMIVMSLCCLLGVIMFVFYKDCHPVKFNNLISRNDQMLPLYIMDILGHLPGIPGIFISCIFSGSLSTLSSAMNGLGAVVPRDVIQPFCCKNISDRMSTVMSKATVFICGLWTIALTFLVSRFGGILQATYSVASITTGPAFGLFVLGMFFPRSNKWGALAGSMTSLAVMTWIGIGAFLTRAGFVPPSAVSTSGCNWNVTSLSFETELSTPNTTSVVVIDKNTTDSSGLTDSARSSSILEIYKMSYLWYLPTAVVIEVVVGLIVSLITGCRKREEVDPRLIHPVLNHLCNCLPKSWMREQSVLTQHTAIPGSDVPTHNKYMETSLSGDTHDMHECSYRPASVLLIEGEDLHSEDSKQS